MKIEKRKNRLNLWLMAAVCVLLFCCRAIPAEAAKVDGGILPSNGMTWSLYDTGTLVISGAGSMMESDIMHTMPWAPYRNQIKEVIIENGVTTVGRCAFSGYDLTNVTLPDSVTSIGEEAFFNNPNLKSVKLPASLTKIEDCAFSCCRSLADVTIPEGVMEIGQEAFAYCDSLTDITLPKSINVIGPWAFDECYGLKNVSYRGTREEWSRITIDRGNEPLTAAAIWYNAREYSLWVNNIQVTSRNAEHILGEGDTSVVFNPKTNTLTLKNAIITEGYFTDLVPVGIYAEGMDLTIDLKGAGNSISNTGGGIYVSGGSLTLKGKGTLKIKNKENFGHDAIFAGQDITVEDGSIFITYSLGGAIEAGGNIEVSGGSIDVSCKDNCFYAEGNMTVKDGSGIKAIESEMARGAIFVKGKFMISGRNTTVSAAGGERTEGAIGAINGIEIAKPLGILTPENGKVSQNGAAILDEKGNYASNVSIGLLHSNLGDVNGDNAVDAKDLTALARHVAKIETITDATLLKNADVDGKNGITPADLTKLARYVAKNTQTL